MKSDFARRTVLYQHRSLFGILLLSGLALVLASYQFWSLPSGLSGAEMASATTSGMSSPWALITNFSQNLASLVSMPWNFLQWLSLQIFGVSVFAIRLPAVILMVLSAVGLILLLTRWFKLSIALISSFLIITSVFFISLARSGTGSAMTIFLLTAALLAATNVIARKSDKLNLFLKIAALAALALLLYMQGGIYVVAILALAGFLHPRTRLLFLRMKTWKIVLAASAGILVILPLLAGILVELSRGEHAIFSSLLAFDGWWSAANLNSALGLLGLQPDLIGGIVAPVITIVGLIIVAIGVGKTALDFTSARAYLTLPLLTVAVVLTLWQPSLACLLFVPFALLTAIGLNTIIGKWYSLFPRNPYARVSAIIPLAVLVLCLSWTSVAQFARAQNYSAAVVYGYNQELSAARQQIVNYADRNQPVSLVVNTEQKQFYELLAKDFKNLNVDDKIPNYAKTVIVLNSANIRPENSTPITISSNWHAENNSLLRVYSFK